MSDDEYHDEEQLAKVPSRIDISEEPEDPRDVCISFILTQCLFDLI
jgi:hypothetical protein